MLDTVENLIFRDKISKVLKNTYEKIDLDELDRYDSWNSSEFDTFNDDERDVELQDNLEKILNG